MLFNSSFFKQTFGIGSNFKIVFFFGKNPIHKKLRKQSICIRFWSFQDKIKDLWFIFSLEADLAKYYQRWLSLFLHRPMDDSHFGYKQKFFKKKQNTREDPPCLFCTLRPPKSGHPWSRSWYLWRVLNGGSFCNFLNL
jgi:hypothetical protein